MSNTTLPAVNRFYYLALTTFCISLTIQWALPLILPSKVSKLTSLVLAISIYLPTFICLIIIVVARFNLPLLGRRIRPYRPILAMCVFIAFVVISKLEQAGIFSTSGSSFSFFATPPFAYLVNNNGPILIIGLYLIILARIQYQIPRLISQGKFLQAREICERYIRKSENCQHICLWNQNLAAISLSQGNRTQFEIDIKAADQPQLSSRFKAHIIHLYIIDYFLYGGDSTVTVHRLDEIDSLISKEQRTSYNWTNLPLYRAVLSAEQGDLSCAKNYLLQFQKITRRQKNIFTTIVRAAFRGNDILQKTLAQFLLARYYLANSDPKKAQTYLRACAESPVTPAISKSANQLLDRDGAN